MAYTTIDNPGLFFNIKLTTGTGSSQAVTGVGFQPDWIWGKRRDSTGHNSLFDSVRGITKGLESNQTNAEFTSTDYYSSFDSDGFTIAAGASGAGNGSSQTAAQWCWRAGTAFSNDASATGIGTIDSSGSTNQTVGFSIVGYTGNGSASQSVAHNLGGTPEMIIFKCRETATDWITFHTKLGGANKNVSLNTNSAVGTDTDYFANTNPTSTVFSVGAASNTNRGSEGMIAYCFRSIQGYSKFGSYTGNGNADGAFIYTGFKPAWVMIKRTDTSEVWHIIDNKRNTFNTVDKVLFAESNAAEATSGSNQVDFVSNGFKTKNSGTQINASGGTYIYMAFAENPFVTAGTKAAGTAR